MANECLLLDSFPEWWSVERWSITGTNDYSIDNWKLVCKKIKLDRDCMVPFLRSKCGDIAAERKIAELMSRFVMYEAVVEYETSVEWPQDCRDLASAGHKRVLGSICLILVALLNLRYYSFMRLF
ncbi:hypothetical protein DdX_20540 [Ditylenchus destructor]|uniref:Uncharacterized protein n=1 Tax=Ditylenchus destructor TaxID=166010 RepID=A0AAD4MKM2_9BILA|nr:hypothetical protein DdX_20540 [Ditylenchus destructor]